MTDRELIRALRDTAPRADWTGWGKPDRIGEKMTEAADRLEALLEENEHLREVTKMMPQWVSVSERLPEYVGYYLVVFAETREVGILDFDTRPLAWTDNDGEEHEILYWMPLPSTEGVE